MNTNSHTTKSQGLLALLALVMLSLILSACNAPVAQKGDSVLVTYTGRFQNGTIFDSNDPANALALGQQSSDKFTSIVVSVGGGSMIKGFDSALLGMKEGETKTVKIKAVDAYGGYDPSKEQVIPKHVSYNLTLDIPREVPVPMDVFLQNKGNATVGWTFDSQNFMYKVTALNSTHATVYITNVTHDPIQFNGLPWNSTLILSTDKTLTFRHIIEDGKTYATTDGPYLAHINNTKAQLTTILQEGQVINTQSGTIRVKPDTNDTLVVDFNHPLAGEDLNFTIKIDKLVKKK